MKYLRIFLLLIPVLALFAATARASDDDDDKKESPDDIPDFGNLDEFTYQPKSTATLGERYISGVKTKFSGNGYISAPEAVPVEAGTGFARSYHDGEVFPDARTETVINANGVSTQTPIQPDGKTNTWSYLTNGQENAAGTGTTSQVTPDDYMQMHIYSAQTEDDQTHARSAKGTTGVELAANRDMGKLGKHFSWTVFGGVTLNDIQSSMTGNVNAAVTTVTDTYDLFGQTVPNGPYGAPSSTQQNIISNGQDLLNSAGDNITQSVDTSTLLGSSPLNRTTTTAVDDVSVADHWKLHGAYLTFRAGPALSYNVTDKLKLTVSAGPELIDASSTYEVTEVLTPNTGGQIIDTLEDVKDKIVPAVYVDATLSYDITDRAGLYLGAFYQDAGGYTQTISGDAVYAGTYAGTTVPTGSYSTRVDFGGQQGLRGGMTFRF